MTNLVTLYCGKVVPSDSMEYLRQCEAKFFWELLQGPGRNETLETLRKKRGPDGTKRVLDKIIEIEPWLVLDLPNKALRQAYAARVDAKRGRAARLALEDAVRAAAAERKKRQQPPAPPASETV